MTSYEINFEARPSYDFFIFANLSRDLMKRAENDELGKYYLVTGFIYTAFSFESMINHYGKVLFNDWETVINKKSRKEIDRIVFNEIGLTDFLGCNLYQNVKRCFEIRNFFSHGKTNDEIVNFSFEGNDADVHKMDRVNSVSHSKIQGLDIESLSEFIEAVEEIQYQIEDNALYPEWHPYAGQKLSECPLGFSGLRTVKKI